MALPKFTTNPTPLYQQQPIIKRQNYGDLYMRNFAAAEAVAYKSFAAIGDIFEKRRLEREKKLEIQQARQANEFRSQGARDRDPDYQDMLKVLDELERPELDDKGLPIDSKLRKKLIEWNKEYGSLDGKIRHGDINPATGEPWTLEDAQRVKDVYDTNIGVIKPSLMAMQDLMNKIKAGDVDLLTKAISEENWKLVSLIHELENKQGFDLDFDMNGPHMSLKWTDDARTNADNDNHMQYEYTLTELKNMDWFANWDERFDYNNEEVLAEYVDLDKKRNEKDINTGLPINPLWNAAAGPVPVISRTTIMWNKGSKETKRVVDEARNYENKAGMYNIHIADWKGKYGEDLYELAKRLHDTHFKGEEKEDTIRDFTNMAMDIILKNPTKYSSTEDNNNDGVPDHAEDLIKIIGSIQHWGEGWKSKKTNGRLMHNDVHDEVVGILSKADFENYYAHTGYAAKDKGQNVNLAITPDTQHLTTIENDLYKVDHLTKSLILIDEGLNVDPEVDTEEPYSTLFRNIARNYDGAAEHMGKGHNVTWREAGTEDKPRTLIRVGDYILKMDASSQGKETTKKKMFTDIINNEPVFKTGRNNIDRLWQGFRASRKNEFFQNEDDRKNAKIWTDWLEQCRAGARGGKNRGYNTTIN